MNRKKLEKILSMNNISKDLYSLNGGLPNEAYCIENVANKWQVYYSERGKKTIIGYFENEEKACKCLLNEINKISKAIYNENIIRNKSHHLRDDL